jgi:TPR repeat protein
MKLSHWQNTLRSTPGRNWIHRVVGVLACTAAVVATAADRRRAKPAQEAQDAAPVLMSRTGGGNSWADVKELTAAADKGNPKAKAQLGELLLKGDKEHGVTQDRARALTLLEQAARAGEGSAAFRIGMVLDDGDGVKQDRERAAAYFRAAAAGGVAEAFHNLGAAHASGRGAKRDYAEALGWLILATKRGADSSAETALRQHLHTLKRPETIAAAERRAVQLEQEFAGKKVADLLPPPAPLLLTNAGAPTGR